MTIMAESDEVTQRGEIYLETEYSDQLERLEVLKSLHLFIIQRKSSVNYFSSKVAYEIMDVRKNVIFKASKPKSMFSSKKSCKISVRNLRNVKLLSTVVESTNSFDSNGTEASVYVYPKKKIAHVEKYGGKVGPPCFEIFNIDRKTAFTIDQTLKKGNNSSTTALDYDVSTKGGAVANILMKTGLNFILSTDPRMPIIEKATLIGVILAMDLLKTGTREANENGATGNQYLFN